MYKESLALIFSAAAIVAVIAILPAMMIWALNVLFQLNIEYNVETIFAAFILLMLVNSNPTSKK
jgi:uncharacterized membrane protein